MSYYSRHSHYSSYSLLGDMYEQSLALNRHEVLWLNKFSPPAHAFMQVRVARDATVQLFVAVMNQLEARCKAAGSTLLKQMKALKEATEDYDYVYNRQTYQHINRGLAGHKVGAAIFLTIFQHCENAVRERFGFKLYDAGVYFSTQNDPDQEFNRYFGDVLPALLAPLAQALPAPDLALERALNLADPKRWQPRFELLLPLLPTQPTQFVAQVYALGQQNEHTPYVATLYQQAAWQLGATTPQATVGLYLHYLYHGAQRYPFRPKQLLKRMQKALFPLPEHLPRFEAIIQELLYSHDLATALAAVPDIYLKTRRKIELNPAAVQAARALHSTTVELLNEYLQETPDSAPTPPPAPPKAVAARPKAAKTAAPKAPKNAPPPITFAAGLALNAGQQALVQLFAAHQLALSPTQVETLARQQGTLRHQLIDGLNEACYALLDDVLVEETDEGYTIYAPHFQKITA